MRTPRRRSRWERASDKADCVISNFSKNSDWKKGEQDARKWRKLDRLWLSARGCEPRGDRIVQRTLSERVWVCVKRNRVCKRRSLPFQNRRYSAPTVAMLSISKEKYSIATPVLLFNPPKHQSRRQASSASKA